MNNVLRPTLAFIFILFSASITHTGLAQELSPDVLKKLKSATVFIVAQTHTDLPQSSGFLIDSNLIVTTAKPLRLNGILTPRSISVIVNSGTPEAKELPAELLAYDIIKDLAFLRIKPSANFSSRDFLQLGKSADTRETQSVTMAGYPLGKILDGSKNPAITVSSVTVSSFRETPTGSRLIQVDGNVIPGNSGGPVIDSKGRVIGVAQSMISATQIGFLIPAEDVVQNLDGRATLVKVVNAYKQEKIYSFQIEVLACDPKRNLQSVSVQFWFGQLGENRPKSAHHSGSTHGAKGDSAKRIVKLARDTKDSTGQRWIADLEGIEFPERYEFWAEFGFIAKSGKFTTVSSTNCTQNFFSAKKGIRPKSAPDNTKIDASTSVAAQNIQMGEFRPRQLIEPVSPYANLVKRLYVEKEGIAIIPTQLEKFAIKNVSQACTSPSGDGVYMTFKGGSEVKKYDPSDYSTVIAKADVGAGAEAVWCDAERVVVACRSDAKLVFLSPNLKERLAEIEIPELAPYAISGRTPDNRLLTIWRDKDEGVNQLSSQYIYLVSPNQRPLLLGKAEAEHVTLCRDNDALLFQQFSGSPSGAPHLLTLSTQTTNRLSDFQLLSPSGMHQNFFHIYPTFDEKQLVFTQGIVNSEPVKSFVVSRDLRSVSLSFPGVAIAEDPVNKQFIVVREVKDPSMNIVPQVEFLNSESGQLKRVVVAVQSDIHPSYFRATRSLSRVIYVPGHEQVLLIDDSYIVVMNCSLYESKSTEGSIVADAIAGLRSSLPKNKIPQGNVSKLQAELASRFRNAKPSPLIVPTASNRNAPPLVASRTTDKAGLPLTIAQSSPEKPIVNLETLLQVVADPNGEKLYMCFANQSFISVYDTESLSKTGEIVVPQFPVSLGFNGSTLVVACSDSAAIVYLDVAKGEIIATSKVPEAKDIKPTTICTPAADGSMVTIWSDGSVYLIDQKKKPLLVARNRIQWCTIPNDGIHLLLQDNFGGSPSGAIKILDTKLSTTSGIPLVASDGPAFGRSNFRFRTTTGHTWMTRDQRNVILPISQYESADPRSYPVSTLVLEPDLSKIKAELPGAVIAEAESIDSYIAWRTIPEDSPNKPIELLYVSRSSGRVYRKISIKGLDVDRRVSPETHVLPTLIYVPGRELLVCHNPKKSVFLQVVRCGPIPDEAAVDPDPNLKPSNSPPSKVRIGKSVKFQPSISLPQSLLGTVSYELSPEIPGIGIDQETGEITFAPRASHLGKFNMKVTAIIQGAVEQKMEILNWVLEIDE